MFCMYKKKLLRIILNTKTVNLYIKKDFIFVPFIQIYYQLLSHDK